MKIFNKTFWFLLFFPIVFISYGYGRTMLDNVGFTLGGTLYGILITATYISIICSTFFLISKLMRKSYKLPLRAIMFSIITGTLISELNILSDELNFFTEADYADRYTKKRVYSRPRICPNSSGSLLWAKERGVWSID